MENHTPGPWMVEQGTTLVWGACTVAEDGSPSHMGRPVADAQLERAWSRGKGPTYEEAEANARLIAAAPDMARAVRASHAWAYCEHHGLGDWSARSTLCAHAEYLNAKALAKMEGRDFDQEYKGSRRMIVWPHVSLEESDEAEAEGLVTAAIEHEANAMKASDLMALHDKTIDALKRA